MKASVWRLRRVGLPELMHLARGRNVVAYDEDGGFCDMIYVDLSVAWAISRSIGNEGSSLNRELFRIDKTSSFHAKHF